MLRFILLLTSFTFSFSVLSSASEAEVLSTQIKFYSSSFELQYDPAMIFKFRTCTRDKCLKDFYEKMDQTNYRLLLDGLLKKKEDLKLNDWFFYKMMRKSVEQIYHTQNEIYQTFVCWFLMTQAGYDTHISTSVNKAIFLYVSTNDLVRYAPNMSYEGKEYINLTAIYFGLDTRAALYEIPAYKAHEGGKPFSFAIENMPEMPAKIVKKTITFKYDEETITIPIEVNEMIKDLMKNYPVVESEQYFKIAPSESLMNSLIPQLRPYLEGKTDQEKVEFLMCLTRRAFEYQWDFDLYYRNQPMISDELFLNDFSDDEDRCALLYHLFKELTDLNFLVINYFDGALTMAVEISDELTYVAKPLEYQGKTYYVCDPVHPKKSKRIGKWPIGMKTDTMKVLEGL